MSAWIEKHRGKHRVRQELRDGGRVSKQTLATFADEESAERFLVAHLERVERGVSVSTTLAAWVEGWLDRRELKGSAERERVKGIDDERSVAKRHVLPSPLALVELARALVAQPSGPALEALVAAAEQLEVVRLVREVRAGGPFAMRRGIELAALLLDASAGARHEGERAVMWAGVGGHGSA